MKRAVALALLMGLVLASLGAQVLHDPYDPIYKDFDLWYARGYIQRLPPVRPYPAQLAAALLDEAERNGDAATAKRAAAYRADLGLGRLRASLKAQLMGENDDTTPLGALGVDGLFIPEPWLAISMNFDIWGVLRTVGDELYVPGIYSPYPDMVHDTSSIGSVQFLQNFNSIASFGTERFYFQAGFNRGSFGPFFDNGLVLGPQAGHAGHFSAAYLGRGWRASILHLGLAATDQYGNDRIPDKHMVVHSFDFDLGPDIEIGVFESVVYGGRLDLLYLAPFNFLFQAQGVTGFYDNSYLGLKGSWRVADGLRFKGLVYVDDLGFNNLAKLRLDTKYKLAGQLGLAWAPARSILRIANVDYTAVMPYMYTHNWDLTKDDFASGAPAATNYSNYLHMGKPIGTELLPNSDRFSVRTSWALPFGAELRLGGELIHHGNASANSGADYGTRDLIFNNGDYIDDGRDKDGNATFQDTTRFLTQDLIETTLRIASGLGFGLRTTLGEFRFGADLVLAWGWNRGLVAGDDGMDAQFSFNASWRY